MGALLTKALRPIKSFNIENRAHRVISKEKPTPAPRYPHNIEDLKRTLEAEPDIDEKLDKKNEGLDKRLKDVYVTSLGRPEVDVTREKKSVNKSKRSLPQDRKMPKEYDFGFKEPERVTYGRTTLRDAINFISAYQTNPNEVTASKIALEYKLKVEDVESVLKYFKTYEVYIPETKTAPAIFAGPAQMRKQLYKLDTKELEANKEQQVATVANTDTKLKDVANMEIEVKNVANVDTEVKNVVNMDTEVKNVSNIDTNVKNVANMDTEVKNVSDIDTNVKNVANMDTEVKNVSDIDTNVKNVANMDTEVKNVSNIDTNVKKAA